MNGKVSLRGKRGFTLTELLVVIGLLSVMISLLFPVISKAQARARSVSCLSNLRQMAAAWTMYLAENKGRLPDYVQSTPTTPDIAWRGYWLGILDDYKVRGDSLLCPAADDPIPYNQINKGFGTAAYAWTGKFMTPGTVARLNSTVYRDSSYGYNRYLTAAGGMGADGLATRINVAKQLSDVPVMCDSVFLDFAPKINTASSPVTIPPNLKGSNFPLGAPDHWRFLIARHGRGVNVAMADGSARWVPLEEIYMLSWKTVWNKCLLSLPMS
jgi:prepilin-type N-terminal cleavage/methylation domain-containing protein/prepilin-type processing-associated H-X9-DG protein